MERQETPQLNRCLEEDLISDDMLDLELLLLLLLFLFNIHIHFELYLGILMYFIEIHRRKMIPSINRLE